MPSGRGIDSARLAPGIRTKTSATRPKAAFPARRRSFTVVGVIYTRRRWRNLLIQKESRCSAHTYVMRCSEPGVGDFDSRSVSADVTYCPKSDFESPEAPLVRF